jgi:hypothetical protein
VDWSANWWTPLARQILENAWWLVAAGGVGIQLIGGGFKIATDIVSYFGADPLRRTVNPFVAASSTFAFSPVQSGGFREVARGRLAAIINDLEKASGPFSKVDIIAHSLGTMVAIDTIREHGGNLFEASTTVRLITMGSPYQNIFQYYFPHLFPDITRKTLPGISECVNIYRSNDYVGTTIADDSDLVSNRPLSPKGHHGYFDDREVLSEIVR